MNRISSTGIVGFLVLSGAACSAPDDASAKEAVAAASSMLCSGDGCNGLDPVETGCVNSAKPVASKKIYRGTPPQDLIGKVTLVYSKTCGTNWAFVRRYDGATAESMIARVVRDGDPTLQADAIDKPQGEDKSYVWSPMVYAKHICAHAEGLVDESYTSGFAVTDTVCD